MSQLNEIFDLIKEINSLGKELGMLRGENVQLKERVAFLEKILTEKVEQK